MREIRLISHVHTRPSLVRIEMIADALDGRIELIITKSLLVHQA